MFFRKKPTIDSFRWDSTGWTRIKTGPCALGWANGFGEFAIQDFGWEVPTGLPQNWRDVDALRAHISQFGPAKIACVSVDVYQLPAGVLCAQYVSKEHMPEPSLGFLYMGKITMPFRDFYCNMVFIGRELGTTGYRECALMAAGKIEMPKQDHIPTVNSDQNLQELYRQARQKPPMVWGSDDEQWDSAFPDHPLSRVRAHLRALRASLTLDKAVLKYPPFGG